MFMRIIRRCDYKSMPWRNGRGTTLEVFRFDRKSTRSDVPISIAPQDTPPIGAPEYTFRVSSAPVNESGPFSLFPGFDRSICVLQGSGMELDVQSCTDEVIHSDLRKGQNVTLNSNTLRNQRTLLLNHSPPFHFSGDLKTTATLIADQPLLDFNIMTRRNVFMQDTKRITIPPVLKHDVEGCRGVDLSVDGVAFVVIHANTGSVSVASHAHHASVQSGDTCVITVDSSVKILHPWVSVRGSNDFCDFIFAIVRSTDLDAPP